MDGLRYFSRAFLDVKPIARSQTHDRERRARANALDLRRHEGRIDGIRWVIRIYISGA
jgi:hypothetical protein